MECHPTSVLQKVFFKGVVLRVPCKSVLQECPSKLFLQRCARKAFKNPARVSCKNIFPKCPTSVPCKKVNLAICSVILNFRHTLLKVSCRRKTKIKPEIGYTYSSPTPLEVAHHLKWHIRHSKCTPLEKLHTPLGTRRLHSQPQSARHSKWHTPLEVAYATRSGTPLEVVYATRSGTPLEVVYATRSGTPLEVA